MSKLDELYKEIQKCINCNLGDLYINKDDGKLNGKVVGYGKGKILFVAQNPNFNRHGAREALRADDYGSNKLFAEMLKEVGLNRDDVFVTNLIKCSAYKNGPLTNEHIRICTQLLWKEIDILKPNIIVPLGMMSTSYFNGAFGQFTEYTRYISRKQIAKDNVKYVIKKYKVFSIFHPAFLIRKPELKGKYIEWLKQIKEIAK